MCKKCLIIPLFIAGVIVNTAVAWDNPYRSVYSYSRPNRLAAYHNQASLYRPYQYASIETFTRTFIDACRDYVAILSTIPTKEERAGKVLDAVTIAALRSVAKKFEYLALLQASGSSVENRALYEAFVTIQNTALTIVDSLGPLHVRAMLRVPFEVRNALWYECDAATTLIRILRDMLAKVAALDGVYASMLYTHLTQEL